MPISRNLVNVFLILFILVSIPITVFVAQRANIRSSANNLPFSLEVSPKTQTVAKGESVNYMIKLVLPDSYRQGKKSVLFHFTELPKGVLMLTQPIGAAPSNDFQTDHTVHLVVTEDAVPGTYEIDVTANDLEKTQQNKFSITVK